MILDPLLPVAPLHFNDAPTRMATIALLATGVIGIVLLGLILFNTLSIRYFTDDFCIALDRNAPIIEQTVIWYQTASGRIAQSVTLLLAFRLGENAAVIVPAAMLAFWVLGAWLIIIELIGLAHIQRPVIVAGVAAIWWVVIVVLSVPPVLQSVYWLTGILTYSASVVVGLFGIALILRAVRRKRIGIGEGAGLFALVLVAGLFNEPYALMQAAAFGLSILLVLRHTLRNEERTGRFPIALVPLGIAIIAAAFALIILLVSPGNTLRTTALVESGIVDSTASPSILSAVGSTAVLTLFFFVGALTRFFPLGLSAAFVIGVLMAYYLRPVVSSHKNVLNEIFLNASALAVVVAAFMFVGVYATGQPPPGRAFHLPLFFTAAAAMALGYRVCIHFMHLSAVRKPMERNLLLVIGIGIIVLVFTMGMRNMLNLNGIMRTFAAEWDARDTFIKMQVTVGNANIVVTPFSIDLASAEGLETLGADPAFWVNQCAAQYYGAESLRVE